MYVVAIGPFEHHELETLRDAALSCDLNLRAFDKAAEAVAALPNLTEAPSGFFASRLRTITLLSSWVRQSPELLNVPIVALIEHPSEGQFRDAFAAGADDALVGADIGTLKQRLETLRSTHSLRYSPQAGGRHGVALVAMSDGPLRRWVGRTLRQAGFELAFAEQGTEVLEAAAKHPTLIVTNRDAAKNCAQAIARMDGGLSGRRTPTLMLEDDAWQTAGQTKGQILFIADEAAARAAHVDARRSQRVLHESICAFRFAGVMEPAYGLTHNLSREGLYVRTLSPAPVGTELWIELRTALGVPVHLRGRVVWRREPGNSSTTSPSGFGFQIDRDQSPSLDVRDWEAAYEMLKSAAASSAVH
jgi:CheY-like chemotaxis protein